MKDHSRRIGDVFVRGGGGGLLVVSAEGRGEQPTSWSLQRMSMTQAMQAPKTSEHPSRAQIKLTRLARARGEGREVALLFLLSPGRRTAIKDRDRRGKELLV